MANPLMNRISRLFQSSKPASRRAKVSGRLSAESLELRCLLSAAPRVLSMAPVDSQAKSSASWALEFSEPVTGVDATDFQVTADSGVTWQSLDILGSGSSRIVTVSGTSGAGLVGLNLVDDGSIRDLDGNLLYGGPGVYLEPVRVPDAALHFSKLLTADFDGDGRSEVIFAEAPSERGPWKLTRMDVSTDGTSQETAISLNSTDAAPIQVLAQDVTGDGRPELLVAEWNGVLSVHSLADDGSSTVLFSGSLSNNAGNPIWYGPGAVPFADFNNDGVTDMALEYNNFGDRSIQILNGNNEGQFFPGQMIVLPNLNTAYTPFRELLTADVNNDGLSDLLFRDNRSSDSGEITPGGRVLLGTISGELVDTGVFSDGFESVVGLARLFDMDGDQNIDWITMHQDSGLSVCRGRGDGTFSAPIPVGFNGTERVRVNPSEIVITSDGDATANLLLFSVATDPVSGNWLDATRVTLFQQDATGQYQLATQLDVSGSVVPLQRTGLQSRLNSQHGLELRVTRYDSTTQTNTIVFQQISISANGQLSASETLSLPGRIDQMADGDADGDGITDTMFIGDSPNGMLENTGISVLLRNAPQQAGEPIRSSISRGEAGGNGPLAMQAAEIDGDGALDVLSVSPSTNTLNFNLGLGNGLFLPTQRFTVGQRPVGLATLDFNRDGLLDAVTANSGDGSLTFLKNTGNGSLQHDNDLVLGGGLSAVAVADFNRDGLTDLAVALPENAAVAVLYGTATGEFLLPQFTATVIAAGKLATGDLNSDGFPDIMVGSATEGLAQVLTGSAAGLQSGTTLTFTAGLQNLIVDDMNQDGALDVLMLTSNGAILVSFGTGNASFTDPELMLNSRATQLSTGDLNGGGPDIVTLTSFPLSTFFEFRSANALGYFTKDGEQQVEHAPRAFTIGDFTGDGRQDLVAADFEKDGLRMFRNTGNGSVSGGFVTIVANFSPGNDAIPPIVFPEDTKEYRVPMTGITPGPGEEQYVRVVVWSTTAPDLLPLPQFVMNANQQSGEFILQPKAAASGVVSVWFYLEDSGDDGDFDTWQDNGYTDWQMLTINITAIRAKLWSPAGPTQEQRPYFFWTDVPDAVEYRVWIGNSSTGVRPQVLTTTSYSAWQPEQDLGIGRYDWYVQAVKADGTRLPWSLKSSFEINTGVYIEPLAARIANPRPTVTWQPVSGADGYEVYVSNLSTGQAGVIREFVTTNKWTPSQDLDLSKYRIWARAVIGGRYNARWSGARDFAICTPPTPIGPSVLTTAQKPTFQWSAVPGAGTYGFQLRNAVTGKVVVDVRGLTTPSFAQATPLAFGRYRWWSIAESTQDGLRSNWSNGVDLIITDRPVLLSPSGTVSGQNLKLTWMDFPGAVSWEVWLNRAQPSQFILSASNLTQREYVLPATLVSGVTYRFWARAVTSDNRTTLWSQPMDFTIANSDATLPDDGEQPMLQLLPINSSTITTALPGVVSERHVADRSSASTNETSSQYADEMITEQALTAAVAEQPAAEYDVADENPVSAERIDAELVGDAILLAIAELDRSV